MVTHWVTHSSADHTAPCAVPVAFEPQGETVAWMLSGDGYLTVSEGAGAAVNALSCVGP